MHTRPLTGLVFICAAALQAQEPPSLPGTQPLQVTGDLSTQMVAGIDRFLMRALEQSPAERARHWRRDLSSAEAYARSVQPNRDRLRRLIGAVDPRVPFAEMDFVSSTGSPALVAETAAYAIYAVRWPVLDGVTGEGLLLEPKGRVTAQIVALPDADQTPEMVCGLAAGVPAAQQFARRLAEHGCRVIVPVLINRQDEGSGNPVLRRFTNQPQREWVWRQAFEMGRHIIGYEVQKILAAVDWLAARGDAPGAAAPRIGVAGYAEGGLLAMYAAALEPRIEAALVSGYFAARERVWEEPIYRDVWGLLTEFGDAEIASLIAPRALIVEYSEAPAIAGPPAARAGRANVAAPGRIATPEFHLVELEVARANALVRPLASGAFAELKYRNEGNPIGPMADRAVLSLLTKLGAPVAELKPPGPVPPHARPNFDPAPRQKRQFDELVEHAQRLLRASERVRDETFWQVMPRTSPEAWRAAARVAATNFWEQLIGRLPSPTGPANPRSRKVYAEEKWIGYDVVLDVWPDVFAWGVLLVPRDLQPGERRPVVVCQHGLEGLPADTITADPKAPGYAAYRAFAARLAERGFIVFAPHNPYRGQYAFRVLQRKAHPLGKSLFSVIIGQHERILEWLGSLPFVDAQRIAFYGLSYGGKTAMRVPAVLEGYCLSICSADFNDWATKCATVEAGYSYLFTVELDMYEFNLGHTWSYAEMAGMIAPRPFMVERGHDDGVAPDEWVAREYARVRRAYARLGLPERTAIEFFNGPHTIHGVGTFEFLHKHLQWP
ncbi:MAG TPA: dienelactone hydrolase family protein [Methylomirabilota bacterium]|nr:dienelactone hydrolase family protein [Methylomirabilota bacterium]